MVKIITVNQKYFVFAFCNISYIHNMRVTHYVILGK